MTKSSYCGREKLSVQAEAMENTHSLQDLPDLSEA